MKANLLWLHRNLGVLAFCALLLVSWFGLHAWSHEQTQRIQGLALQRIESRMGDCHALDDLGSAIKAGVNALAPTATSTGTPEQIARAKANIAKYTEAVDKSIASAKQKKGYSLDCTHV